MKSELPPIILEMTPDIYRQTAESLREAVGAAGYFSGSVCFTHQDIDCRLTTSVIVYREQVCAPDGVGLTIRSLVPVWWEFHTVTSSGEVLNDFSFGEMIHYL